MSVLFQDKSKVMTDLIAGDCVAIDDKAKFYTQNLYKLQKELLSVKNKNELHRVVQKLIVAGNDIQQSLNEKAKGARREDVAKDINSTKEKLSENELLEGLTKEQSEVAVNFLKALKELKPIAEILNIQKKQFQKRLKDADSLDLIAEIESEVQVKADAMDGFLKELLPYPEDEVVAGKLIKFLQDNSNLMDVFQFFDMEEVLIDDIPNARENLSMNHNRLGS